MNDRLGHRPTARRGRRVASRVAVPMTATARNLLASPGSLVLSLGAAGPQSLAVGGRLRGRLRPWAMSPTWWTGRPFPWTRTTERRGCHGARGPESRRSFGARGRTPAGHRQSDAMGFLRAPAHRLRRGRTDFGDAPGSCADDLPDPARSSCPRPRRLPQLPDPAPIPLPGARRSAWYGPRDLGMPCGGSSGMELAVGALMGRVSRRRRSATVGGILVPGRIQVSRRRSTIPWGRSYRGAPGGRTTWRPGRRPGRHVGRA